IPAEPARVGAAVPAGPRPSRSAHAGSSRASDGEGGGDRSRRPRFPAVLGQQGWSDRWLAPLSAYLRPRVRVAGTDPRARDARCGAPAREQRADARAADRAAATPVAGVGDTPGATVQPAPIARARRHVRRPLRRLAV